jgi:hypothetical protein
MELLAGLAEYIDVFQPIDLLVELNRIIMTATEGFGYGLAALANIGFS